MKAYKNYLFDLYGTLVDVHTDEENDLLWQRFSIALAMEGIERDAQALKADYRARIAALEARDRAQRGPWAEIDIGPVFAQLCGIAPEDARIPALARLFRLLSLEKLRLFPGAAELLRRLRGAGKRVYLLSNAQSLFTMPELMALGLEPLFDGIIISSCEGLKKPDAGLYRLALERYQLDPTQTVMVGNDDRADCWGAAGAGLDSMYICTEQSPKQAGSLPVNCRLLKQIGDVFE